MARKPVPQIVAANHLIEGDAIWFDGAGWTRDVSHAAVAHDAEQSAVLLARAGQGAEAARAVGLYLVEVALCPDQRPRPTHFREVFRVKHHRTHPREVV